jgi:hypothetical protein
METGMTDATVAAFLMHQEEAGRLVLRKPCEGRHRPGGATTLPLL